VSSIITGADGDAVRPDIDLLLSRLSGDTPGFGNPDLPDYSVGILDRGVYRPSTYSGLNFFVDASLANDLQAGSTGVGGITLTNFTTSRLGAALADGVRITADITNSGDQYMEIPVANSDTVGQPSLLKLIINPGQQRVNEGRYHKIGVSTSITVIETFDEAPTNAPPMEQISGDDIELLHVLNVSHEYRVLYFSVPPEITALGERIRIAVSDEDSQSWHFPTAAVEARILFARLTLFEAGSPAIIEPSAPVRVKHYDAVPGGSGRIEPLGHLLEGETTNYLSYSTPTFSDASWSESAPPAEVLNRGVFQTFNPLNPFGERLGTPIPVLGGLLGVTTYVLINITTGAPVTSPRTLSSGSKPVWRREFLTFEPGIHTDFQLLFNDGDGGTFALDFTAPVGQTTLVLSFYHNIDCPIDTPDNIQTHVIDGFQLEGHAEALASRTFYPTSLVPTAGGQATRGAQSVNLDLSQDVEVGDSWLMRMTFVLLDAPAGSVLVDFNGNGSNGLQLGAAVDSLNVDQDANNESFAGGARPLDYEPVTVILAYRRSSGTLEYYSGEDDDGAPILRHSVILAYSLDRYSTVEIGALTTGGNQADIGVMEFEIYVGEPDIDVVADAANNAIRIITTP